MMTPRSRQPVLAVSGSNNTNLLTKEKNEFRQASNDTEDFDKTTKSHPDDHFQTCLGSSKDHTKLSNQSGDSLTDTFREYLYSRSMLTTSFADDSFSSRTGDFDPSSLSEDKISDSLLYCLDGGTPKQQTNPEYYHDSFPNEANISNSNYIYDDSHVHETLL